MIIINWCPIEQRIKYFMVALGTKTICMKTKIEEDVSEKYLL